MPANRKITLRQKKDDSSDMAMLALIAAIFVTIYLIIINKKQENTIRTLEDDKEKLRILFDAIQHSDQFDQRMENQLRKMVEEYNVINPDIANELAQALEFLQVKQPERAIEYLVKIMEYLLNKKYSADSMFEEWVEKENKKKRDLHAMLTYSKKTEYISEIEYGFYVAVKTIRNKEVHTLGLKIDKYLNISGLMTAMGAIIRLAKDIYPLYSQDQGKTEMIIDAFKES